MGGVMDLRDELIKAAGTHQRAARVLRILARQGDLSGVAVPAAPLRVLAGQITAMDGEPRDPEVGDSVILRGTIEGLHGGEALVRVHGASPDDAYGGYMSMLCGQLEHDTAVALFDGGVAACPGDGCPGCPDCARPSSVPSELAES